MLKIKRLFFILLLITVGCTPNSQALTRNKWQLTIIPSSDNSAIEITSKNSFKVSLKNISTEKIRFWNTNNSWGYSALFFTIKNNDGKTFTVNKEPRGWRKNSPTFIEIEPNNNYVFNVAFSDNTWKIPELSPGKYTIQANISITEDSKSKQLNIWTGNINSEIYHVFVQ